MNQNTNRNNDTIGIMNVSNTGMIFGIMMYIEIRMEQYVNTETEQ